MAIAVNVYNDFEKATKGYALEAALGKGLYDEVYKINSRLSAAGTWRTYSENHWKLRYRHVTGDIIYFSGSNSDSLTEAIKEGLAMGNLPFIAAFDQKLALTLYRAGTPVGYGFAKFAENAREMWISCTAYEEPVIFAVSGYIQIK